MIDSKDISVIVQGAIDKKNTPKCLASIRKCLPYSEIILSTWEGSNVEGLDYDVLLLNNDPGGFDMSKWEKNNVKRQIYSTLQGLKITNRKYALKIRSDIRLVDSNFLKYFNLYRNYNKEWHFLEERIIIPSLITRDPRIWESPMCPSDWCSFGLTSDMLKLWDIPFPTDEEVNWFKYHQKDDSVKKHYYPLQARFNPEQFIWYGFVKKYKNNLHVEHMFDINQDSIKETLLSYANNLIILSEDQFGIEFLKQGRKGSDKWHIVTHLDFLKLYNEYANGKEKISIFDIQRLKLFKYFKTSNERLYKLAVRNNECSIFIQRELDFYFPILGKLYKVFKNLYLLLKGKSDSDYIFIRKNEKVKFSIVVPTHDNPDFLKQTLESLKVQTFKDFEIILSDDSNKKNNRDINKKMLLSIFEDMEINIKYIFTKPNLGQSLNTNQGLKFVEGEWVRILHSDDILQYQCLEKEFEKTQKNNDIIAIFHNLKIFSNEDCVDVFASDDEKFYVKHNPEFIIDNSLHSHCAIPSSLLFNSEILGKIDWFNPNLLRGCDWDFWSRIVLYAYSEKYKLLQINDECILYRVHSKSNTNNLKTKLVNYDEYEKISNNIVNVLKQKSYPNYFISNFANCAYAYRKKRLVNDYNNLGLVCKLLLLSRFIKRILK